MKSQRSFWSTFVSALIGAFLILPTAGSAHAVPPTEPSAGVITCTLVSVKPKPKIGVKSVYTIRWSRSANSEDGWIGSKIQSRGGDLGRWSPERWMISRQIKAGQTITVRRTYTPPKKTRGVKTDLVQLGWGYSGPGYFRDRGCLTSWKV